MLIGNQHFRFYFWEKSFYLKKKKKDGKFIVTVILP